MTNDYLITYPSVKYVEGKSKGLLMDFQKEKYYVIPLSLIFVLKELENVSYSSFITGLELSKEQLVTIEEYIVYLIDNDIVFWGNQHDKNGLQKIHEVCFSPVQISNVLLDFDKDDYLTKKIIEELSSLSVRAVQIRYYSQKYLQTLDDQIALFNNSTIRHIDILLPYFENIELFLSDFFLKYDRVSFVTVYNSPFNKFIDKIDFSFAKLVFSTDQIKNEKMCGKISKLYLSCNINSYMESKQFNSCLNQKISIDKQGNICNCPSMKNNFGHIADTKLSDVINNPVFTNYWFIKKDDTKKCKDCEFRHICTDCRAYIEDPEDIYSKPLKCGYNPYTGEWSEWSTHPLKQKAMEYYGMEEM